MYGTSILYLLHIYSIYIAHLFRDSLRWASKWGAAALVTRAKQKEVKRESKWAEDKGWFLPRGFKGFEGDRDPQAQLVEALMENLETKAGRNPGLTEGPMGAGLQRRPGAKEVIEGDTLGFDLTEAFEALKDCWGHLKVA